MAAAYGKDYVEDQGAKTDDENGNQARAADDWRNGAAGAEDCGREIADDADKDDPGKKAQASEPTGG